MLDDAVFEPLDDWEAAPALHHPGSNPLIHNPFAWDLEDDERSSAT